MRLDGSNIDTRRRASNPLIVGSQIAISTALSLVDDLSLHSGAGRSSSTGNGGGGGWNASGSLPPELNGGRGRGGGGFGMQAAGGIAGGSLRDLRSGGRDGGLLSGLDPVFDGTRGDRHIYSASYDGHMKGGW